MSARTALIAAVAAVALAGQARGAAFTAYNDLAGDDSTGNVTNIHPRITGALVEAHAAVSGELIDYLSGAGTGVQLTLSTNSKYGQDGATRNTNGTAGNAGTPLYNAFNGKVDMRGVQYYDSASTGGGDVQFKFASLDPDYEYTVTFGLNRNGGSTYSGRLARLTISGADVFSNSSTSGVTISTLSAANDVSVIDAGNNSSNGYLVQYSGIRSGTDGEFTVSLTGGGDPRWYSNALSLSGAPVPEPTSLAVLGIAGLLLVRRQGR